MTALSLVRQPVVKKALYVLLGVSLFGVVLGIAGGDAPCQLPVPSHCVAPASNNHLFAIISAAVALVVIVILRWSRGHDRTRDNA